MKDAKRRKRTPKYPTKGQLNKCVHAFFWDKDKETALPVWLATFPARNAKTISLFRAK